jgi:3-oxoacyl-[acyl-carrier protein] reductase
MKTIIITGDSRGLGAEIIETLLNDQYEVIGLSRSESDNVSSFEREYPNQYKHINFDLSNTSRIEMLYKEDLKSRGPIYGLVNNAAMPYDDLVTNANEEDLNQLFKINTLSPILLTKAVLRDMILNRTKGSLVHISSVSTATGYKGLSMYGATKGALESFSLGVAREWGERGIRSNCIAPGFMNTKMTSTLDEEQKNRIYDRTGLGEPTDPQSVAAMVEFLLSDASSTITGEVIRNDAGTL